MLIGIANMEDLDLTVWSIVYIKGFQVIVSEKKNLKIDFVRTKQCSP